MTTRWQQFYERLGQPIRPWMRLLLLAAIVPLALGAAERLWTIRFFAPQYPYGLELHVYTYTIGGGNDGKDLPEINTLNHYVGMRKLDPAEFADLDFLPFAVGALVLLTLRVAAIGDVRALVDLAVLTGYFGVFSLGRFAYMLYTYGHHLDPHAPIQMAGFTPPVIGTKAIANFSVSSYPALGTVLITLFGITVVLLALWHLARALRPAAA
jgi:copper chaperone NosL